MYRAVRCCVLPTVLAALILGGAVSPAAAAVLSERAVDTRPVDTSPADTRPVDTRPAGDLSVLLTLAQTPQQAASLKALAAQPFHRRAALGALRPAATAVPAIRAYAQARGLRIGHLTSGSLLLSGPSAQLAELFSTSLARTADGDAYATTPLQVPAALSAFVGTAVGLDARPLVRPRAVPLGLDGDDLRAAYDVRAPASTGAGVTVGALQFSGWNPTDLTTYARAAGITLRPGQITEIGVAGVNPHLVDDTGGDAEVALDAQAILATAPAAKQRIYFAPNTAIGSIMAIHQMADDAAAGLLQVTSSSWGSCEAANSVDYQQAFGEGLDRLVAAGATFFVASGDMGAYGCSQPDQPDNALSVDFPSSWPNAVAVGGTTLNHTPSGYTEKAWGTVARTATAGTFAGNGSGGGLSLTQSQPAYQSGLRPGSTGRLVPDVSSVADPASGFGVYVTSQGGWGAMGGTSLSAPTWAGFVAAALSSAGRTTGLGNILPTLYANPSAFRDVTSGSNGPYDAVPGFDLVTGLGSPNWNTLGALLVGLPNTLSIAQAPVPAAYPQLFTITGTAAPHSVVTLHFHRGGTAADDYRIVRTVTADARGRWSRQIASTVDYRYYATAGTARTPTVLYQPAPTVAGPVVRRVAVGAVSTVSGRAVPGSLVYLHIHAPGTPADDYSIVRTVLADRSGSWSRRYLADTDYRLFVSRDSDDSTISDATVLLQAR